jgi:type II secretory pathway pseudopilin PulG
MVEMLITVVILGILATTAIAGYQSMMAKSKLQTDKVNVMMLLQATKTYYLENDRVPASLAALPQAYHDRAFAQVLNTPMKRFAYALESKMQNAGSAYAVDAGGNYTQSPCTGSAYTNSTATTSTGTVSTTRNSVCSGSSDSLCAAAKNYGLNPSMFVSAADPNVYFVYMKKMKDYAADGTKWDAIPGDEPLIGMASSQTTTPASLETVSTPHKVGGAQVGVYATKGGAKTTGMKTGTSQPPVLTCAQTRDVCINNCGTTNLCKKSCIIAEELCNAKSKF